MPAYVCWKSRFPAPLKELGTVDAPDLATALCVFGGRYGRDNVTPHLTEWHGRGGERRYLVQPARGRQSLPDTPAATLDPRCLFPEVQGGKVPSSPAGNSGAPSGGPVAAAGRMADRETPTTDHGRTDDAA